MFDEKEDLKDTHNAFWWETLNVKNICLFIQKLHMVLLIPVGFYITSDSFSSVIKDDKSLQFAIDQKVILEDSWGNAYVVLCGYRHNICPCITIHRADPVVIPLFNRSS